MILNQQSPSYAVVGPHAQHRLFTLDPVEDLIFRWALMVLPVGRQPWAVNEPLIKHMVANFEDAVEEAVEPVGPWVHATAAMEM